MNGVRLVVFAGTSDGRALGEEMAAAGVPVLLCVATQYGGELVPEQPNLFVHEGRLDEAGMLRLLQEHDCPPVVDATHPYAAEVTRHLRAACLQAGVEYIRLLRERWQGDGTVRTVASTEHAAKLLAETTGRVLLTVGSKELAAFTQVPDFRERLFARVLPSADIVAKCEALGFAGRQLICMQGPFSHELNVAMIRSLGVQYLVTKDSGAAGGFAEKLSAVRETDISMLLVARPDEEQGLSPNEVRALLYRRFSLQLAPVQREQTAGCPRFPLFVSLAGKRVCVVGGGQIAERRVQTLLDFGADVAVVSPLLTPALARLAQAGAVSWQQRSYRTGDCTGAALVVAATDVRAVNAQVGAEARAAGIPVSVADDAAACTFYFPAIIRAGGLVAGLVSAEGNRHADVKKAAAILRERLEEVCE